MPKFGKRLPEFLSSIGVNKMQSLIGWKAFEFLVNWWMSNWTIEICLFIIIIIIFFLQWRPDACALVPAALQGQSRQYSQNLQNWLWPVCQMTTSFISQLLRSWGGHVTRSHVWRSPYAVPSGRRALWNETIHTYINPIISTSGSRGPAGPPPGPRMQFSGNFEQILGSGPPWGQSYAGPLTKILDPPLISDIG